MQSVSAAVEALTLVLDIRVVGHTKPAIFCTHTTATTTINKKVGKTYNAADAWHVDFPKFRGRGAPMVVDISGVTQGVSELLQAVYTKL